MSRVCRPVIRRSLPRGTDPAAVALVEAAGSDRQVTGYCPRTAGPSSQLRPWPTPANSSRPVRPVGCCLGVPRAHMAWRSGDRGSLRPRVSADVSGKLRIWDTTQKEHLLKYEYQPFAGKIKDIAWTEDSKRIAVVGEGREK